MGTLFFIARCFVVTVFVIMMMQIKIGEFTIENRIEHYARTSGIEQPAQKLADGIVRFVRNTWRSVTSGVKTDFGKTLRGDNAPGSRDLGIDLRRSAEYIEEQAQKAKQKVEGHLRDEGIIITDDP